MLRPALLIAAALLAAGCLAPMEGAIVQNAALAGAPSLAILDTKPVDVADGGATVFFHGAELAAPEREGSWTPLCLVSACWSRPACSPEACETWRFEVGPADAWQGALEVSIAWRPPGDYDAWYGFDLEVTDPTGKTHPSRGGLARVVLIEDPAPGVYEATVIATWGTGAYHGVVQLEPRPAREGPARELLPNLVVLPPADLRIEDPRSDPVSWFLPGLVPRDLLGKGCSAYEAAEAGARRCLRFSNAIGNTGEGPLEVRLTTSEGAKALAGAGRHVQRIHLSDGTFRDVDAGPATFHPTHTHFHYDDLSEFAVYEHDVATGTRGALVNTGNKGGICLVDIGLVELGLPGTPLPNYDITCFYPAFSALAPLWGAAPPAEWTMSLSPNWYDLYGWGLDDMYVDLTGVPDGVYELVSVVNPTGTVVETDTSDNEASVVFRLTGHKVEVLDV